MALVTESKKACAVNPLKMSQPLGAAYAFMGLDSCMPVMHGSQGCTSFGLVLLVRHFKEAIPLQTTAMNEATTIMGGYDNLAKALLNIRQRAKPQLIAICSTGLTETKGDDVEGYLTLARQKHPELADTAIVYVSTPDYVGAFQDGWAKAVEAVINQFDLGFQPIPAIAIRRTWNAERASGETIATPTDTTSYGHNVELAWLLNRAAETIGLPPGHCNSVVRKLVDHSLRYGFDHELGGVYRDGPHAGPALVRDKEFWQNCEALVGYLDAYAHLGDNRYLDAFLKTWQFDRTHMIDH